MCIEGQKENSFIVIDDDKRLANIITKLAGKINAAYYRFLKRIAEFDRREAWSGFVFVLVLIG